MSSETDLRNTKIGEVSAGGPFDSKAEEVRLTSTRPSRDLPKLLGRSLGLSPAQGEADRRDDTLRG
jgi:hypothetical protein